MKAPSKVLLMGHPNVGKSALFNRLSGAQITESNYPGTTVDYTESELVVGDQRLPIVDVPGAFSLDPRDRAEEVAVEMLDDSPDALVLVVVDTTRIERGLNFVLEVLERDRAVVVALNMWDEAKKRQIDIDAERMEELLGVPVVPTVATEGTGIDTLLDRFDDARSPSIGAVVDRIEASTEVEA